jgi:Chaperone of endosialidase
MKKFLLFQAFFCLCFQIWAQTPDKFNYQAVAKNANGTPVTGAVEVQFTILTGSTSGTEVYKELHNNVTADANGLFSLQIGSGTTLGGSIWSNINWGAATKFLKVEVKTSTGGGFVQMGDPQQLISVPYAQEAKHAKGALSIDLPFTQTVSSGQHGFHVTNETESGISGQSNKPGAAGTIGSHPGDGIGIYGRAEGTFGTSIVAQHKSGKSALLGTQTEAAHFDGDVSISSGILTVNGQSPNADAFFKAFTYDFNVLAGPFNCNPCLTNYSIAAASAVRGSEFQAMSDTRIKNIIAQSNAPADLTTLMHLKVTDYTHKDFVNKGTAAKKGFIAQEVEKEFAEAVTKGKDFIPNIYLMAQSTTFDAVAKTLSVTLEKAPDLAVGNRVRIIADKPHEVEVTEVNGTSFTVKNWENVESKHIFVFGKEVDDFRTVDYDRIFTLNVSATQELARKVVDLQNQNSVYQEKFQQLESKLNALSAQLNGSENKGIGSSNK